MYYKIIGDNEISKELHFKKILTEKCIFPEPRNYFALYHLYHKNVRYVFLTNPHIYIDIGAHTNKGIQKSPPWQFNAIVIKVNYDENGKYLVRPKRIHQWSCLGSNSFEV